MKTLICITLLTFYVSLSGQSNTEVYLLDCELVNGENKLVNLTNISNNEGYDNQPSFYNDSTILFTATRNNQTDIAKYDITKGTTSWVTNTNIGSEYSPLKIPNQNAISTIRLDTNGLQRLYKIDLDNNNKTTELLKDVVVGYHVWYSENILVCSVLADNQMNLVVANLKEKTSYTAARNVGRSLHKIPDSDLISFISKEGESWAIKSIHPTRGASKKITRLPKKKKDMCWLNDGTILLPSGKKIFKFNPKTDKSWRVLYRFEEENINEISRIAISPDGNHLSLVSEEAPTIIIDRQVESFNERNLDNFAACFSEDVVVLNFPSDTMYVGNTKLKSSYEKFFAKNPSTKVEVIKRIVIGNKVIDEERVSVNGKTHRQAAVYKVENGKIASMMFIKP